MEPLSSANSEINNEGDTANAREMNHTYGAPETVAQSNTEPLSNSSASRRDIEYDDDAMVIVNAEPEGKITFTQQEVCRLKIKIDLRIMLLMCTVYFLQFVDQIAVSYGSVMGMLEDTHINQEQFAWVSAIFYFGMLGMEPVTIFIIQRFPLGQYAGFWVAGWGAVLACQAACTNYAGLLVSRFFLGVAQTAVNPCWIMLTTQWYTKEEQNFRTGLWLSMNGLAQVIGGAFAYGVAIHVGSDPNRKLNGWQVVFLVLGLFTFVFGVLVFFFIPDSPANASFLNDREKAIHMERIRGNEQGVGSHKFKCSQIKEALLDPYAWLFIIFMLTYGVTDSTGTSFGNIIVSGMGYEPPLSLLMLTPFGAVEFITFPIVAYFGMLTGQRIVWGIAGQLVGLAGGIMIAAVPSGAIGLAGFSIAAASVSGPFIVYSLISSNVAGTTKKQTVSCLTFMIYAVGNIISPQTFQASDAPEYVPAKITICAIFGVCIAMMILLRQLCVCENNKRDRAKENGDYNNLEANHAFMDLTDRENIEFRYSI